MKKAVILLLCCLFGFLFLGSFAQDTLVIKDKRLDLFASLSDTEKLDTLISLTDSLITRDLDVSLCYAQEALNLSEKLNNQESSLAVTIQLAKIYTTRTELIKAMAFVEQAKALALKLNKKRKYVYALIMTGNIYNALGDYEKSVEVIFEALKISEKIMDKDLTGKAFCSIGIVYAIQKNNTKALEYYNQSLEIARQNNDLNGISRDLNNVATIYVMQEEYQKAIILLKEAASINKKNGRKLWEGINYHNLGIINYNIKNYDTAYLYYQKAVSIYSELNSTPNLVNVHIRLAEYFNEINNPTKRLFYSIKAFEICKDSDLKESIYHAAMNLHTLYSSQHDSINAYKYALLEYQLKDRLELNKSIARLTQLEQLRAFEKETKEKELLQQQKNYTYIIWGTSLFSLFVFAIILLIARSKIKTKNAFIEKKQLENDIEIKNKELTSNVMSLMRKNEVLTEIARKLMDIRKEAVKDETKYAIKKIVKELQSSKDKEIWNEFDIRFKQVHNEFYDKLIARFPDLTPTEQRLCAFLKLNMTSKEISELTGQRTSTIEVTRTRLRKKLGLTYNNTNLVTFLSHI